MAEKYAVSLPGGTPVKLGPDMAKRLGAWYDDPAEAAAAYAGIGKGKSETVELWGAKWMIPAKSKSSSKRKPRKSSGKSAVPANRKGKNAEKMNAVLAELRKLHAAGLLKGAQVDLVGAWLWITFKSKPPEETRAALGRIGFRYSKRRGKWAHSCGVPAGSSNKVNPFVKYGRKPVKLEEVEAVS